MFINKEGAFKMHRGKMGDFFVGIDMDTIQVGPSHRSIRAS